jgi:NAD(P)-dependent dehydrogenase (short-subunit alcohol dehydrogenase family)
MNLENRVAVVTGGAGIVGSSVVEAMCKYGARVALIDTDASNGKLLESNLKSEGFSVNFFECDLTSENSVRAIANEIQSELGAVSILHNNAASKGDSAVEFFQSTEEYSIKTWRQVMEVNLEAMFNVARIFGSQMIENKYGSIVQTSSIYGGAVAPDQRIYDGSEYMGLPINTPAVYTTSKAAVVGLTKHLATHWADKGIRVNCVTPGGIRSGQNDTFVETYSKRVPLGRMAEASEIASAVVFLASDAASYITGQNLIVDGGLSVW